MCYWGSPSLSLIFFVYCVRNYMEKQYLGLHRIFQGMKFLLSRCSGEWILWKVVWLGTISFFNCTLYPEWQVHSPVSFLYSQPLHISGQPKDLGKKWEYHSFLSLFTVKFFICPNPNLFRIEGYRAHTHNTHT